MQIGQKIISADSFNENKDIVISNKIQSFSIQALPGCKVAIDKVKDKDDNFIMLGPAGLLNVDIPVSNITIPQVPNQGLLTGANTFMVIDYIYEDKVEIANE